MYKHEAFLTEDMEISLDCPESYHLLHMNCANGILIWIVICD